MDASKYSRSVTMLCPTCGNTDFEREYLLLIHELHPELLQDDHRHGVDALIWERLLTEEAPKDTWTSLHKALADTEQMISEGNPAKLDILAGLRTHLLARIEQGRARV